MRICMMAPVADGSRPGVSLVLRGVGAGPNKTTERGAMPRFLAFMLLGALVIDLVVVSFAWWLGGSEGVARMVLGAIEVQ